MDPIYNQLYKAGLVRNSADGWLAGVCAGIADKVGADANAVRLVTFLLMVLLPGSPVLLYAIAWLVMPDENWRPPLERGQQHPPVNPGTDSGPQDYIPPSR